MTGELRHVLWIGGPPGSGKTSIATRLARRHGLRWYGSDTRTWAHRDQAIAAGHPAALRWEAMTPEERSAVSSPAELLELSLHAGRGPMIVDDLRALPTAPMIVAEGTPISPAFVSSGLADRGRAVWLAPAPAFQRARLQERHLPPGPRRLYLLLAEELERDLSEHDVATILVDGSASIEETYASVEHRFAAALEEGPRAASRTERRALLREANESIADQVRDHHERPWATREADAVVRAFLCECGDTTCDASVDLAVGASAAGPVVAAGHA